MWYFYFTFGKSPRGRAVHLKINLVPPKYGFAFITNSYQQNTFLHANCFDYLKRLNFVKHNFTSPFPHTDFISLYSKTKFYEKQIMNHVRFWSWKLILLRSSQYKILWHFLLSIPPENIRKPLDFWCFQGVQKETSNMKWIK